MVAPSSGSAVSRDGIAGNENSGATRLRAGPFGPALGECYRAGIVT